MFFSFYFIFLIILALFVQPWLQGRREATYFIELYNYTNATGSPTPASFI
jgi:hypothetical protein